LQNPKIVSSSSHHSQYSFILMVKTDHNKARAYEIVSRILGEAVSFRQPQAISRTADLQQLRRSAKRHEMISCRRIFNASAYLDLNSHCGAQRMQEG
jgi:hypothetical protein